MKPILERTCRSLRWAGAVAALAALTCGCEYPDRYTIVMTARGDSLERSIRVQRIQDRADSLQGYLRPHLESGIEDMLTSAYHVRADTAMNVAYVASERFADVPNDIGTRGRYRHLSTPLGDYFSYAERIRGMDDPGAWVARRFASADTLAAAVGGWLRFELVTQPEWPRISAELEPELRSMAGEFVAVMLAASGRDSLQSGWLLALAPEYPLFALMAVPGLSGVSDEISLAPHLAHARDELARRLGLLTAGDGARVLGFLADVSTSQASFERWTQSSPQARAFNGDRVLTAMLTDPHAGAGNPIVEIELRVPQKPFATNGEWNEGAKCIRWRAWCAWLENRDIGLPVACAADWCVPDSVAQHRLFGDVVLDDERLFIYADWFTTLAPARQAEWNRMLLALRPGRTAALERFRFGDEKGETDASAYVRSVIFDALHEQAEKRGRATARPAPASPPARSR